MLTPEAWMTQLHTALRDRLGGAARAWLDVALDEAHAEAQAEAEGRADTANGGGPPSYTAYALPVWEMRFASAGRHCTRREPPHARDPEAAEAARILLLHTARAGLRTVTRLYDHGTAAERRAVLMALPHLHLGASARPLVEDALRTNDTRLVAAAVGPYAARHLDPHAWRHAVLKCLFTGVPVTAVAGLAERARGDTELARMLAEYARERTAAHRPVPADIQHVLDLIAPTAPPALIALPAPTAPPAPAQPPVSPTAPPPTSPATAPPASPATSPTVSPATSPTTSPSPATSPAISPTAPRSPTSPGTEPPARPEFPAPPPPPPPCREES